MLYHSIADLSFGLALYERSTATKSNRRDTTTLYLVATIVQQWQGDQISRD